MKLFWFEWPIVAIMSSKDLRHAIVESFADMLLVLFGIMLVFISLRHSNALGLAYRYGVKCAWPVIALQIELTI